MKTLYVFSETENFSSQFSNMEVIEVIEEKPQIPSTSDEVVVISSSSSEESSSSSSSASGSSSSSSTNEPVKRKRKRKRRRKPKNADVYKPPSPFLNRYKRAKLNQPRSLPKFHIRFDEKCEPDIRSKFNLKARIIQRLDINLALQEDLQDLKNKRRENKTAPEEERNPSPEPLLEIIVPSPLLIPQELSPKSSPPQMPSEVQPDPLIAARPKVVFSFKPRVIKAIEI